MPDTTPARNVVVLGEVGVGKSSVVNMIVKQPVAPVSDSPMPTTQQSICYPIYIRDLSYHIYDTPGIDPENIGVDNVTQLSRDLQDASLLVFCMRGRITEGTVKIYEAFSNPGRIPAVIVITGLENEDDMESWWEINQYEIEGSGMRFDGHACVTGSRGKKLSNRYASDEDYNRSRKVVGDLIANLAVDPTPWEPASVLMQNPLSQEERKKRRRKWINCVAITTVVVGAIVITGLTTLHGKM